ncbi:MAG TPA: cytochrome ubiquinol oxidase subunit I, partial [Ilumatobacteraceae bacterium]
FQTMVGAGSAMVGISAWYMWRRRRGRDPFGSRLFLWAAVAAGGLSVVALEAGWITTEVGRQPWIANEVMRVEDAVTGNSGIWISFTAVVIVYTSMGIIAVRVLRSMARRWRESGDLDLPTPYGPGGELVENRS